MFWTSFAVTAGGFTGQFPQAGGGDGTATLTWLSNANPTGQGEYGPRKVRISIGR